MIKISFSALLLAFVMLNISCSQNNQSQERQQALAYLHNALNGMNTKLLTRLVNRIEIEREVAQWQNPQQARTILVDKNFERNRTIILSDKKNMFEN